MLIIRIVFMVISLFLWITGFILLTNFMDLREIAIKELEDIDDIDEFREKVLFIVKSWWFALAFFLGMLSILLKII